jgi:hypothetical protein
VKKTNTNSNYFNFYKVNGRWLLAHHHASVLVGDDNKEDKGKQQAMQVIAE